MTTSSLFRIEYDSFSKDALLKHLIYTCVQWKGPNLEELPQATMQRFCVAYNHWLDYRLIAALELAYARGMLSPIKLITLDGHDLHFYLDTSVTSNTLAEIQSWWNDFTELGLIGRYRLVFASEDEMYSGRSDCPLGPHPIEVLKSRFLGLYEFEFPDLEPYDPESYSQDDDLDSFFNPDGLWY